MWFDMICEANDIKHVITKPNHLWTNGQMKRMDPTITEAAIKRFHDGSHEWTCLGKVESSLEVKGELNDEAATVHEGV